MRRSRVLLLALMLIVCAVWLYLFIAAPQQQTLEQRTYNVAAQLKCPVCQNESVASSSASIAEQMRQVIYQQLQAGKSEQQVLDYFAARYGNSILLTPPQQGFPLLAWLMPIAILLAGSGLLYFVTLRWRQQSRLQTLKLDEQAGDELIDAEFTRYQAQLERELLDDDPLFRRPGTEIN